MRPHKLRLFVNPLPIHFPLIYKINLNHQAAKILILLQSYKTIE